MTAVVVKLKRPVEVKGNEGEVLEKIAELKMTRLTGKMMRAADGAKGEMGKTLALIAASANVPPLVVDLMDAEDIVAAGAVIADFMGGALPTGGR